MFEKSDAFQFPNNSDASFDALCKINNKNCYWGTTACGGMVIPATFLGLSPLLHNWPHTPLVSSAINGITLTTKMNVLDPFCLWLEQLRGAIPMQAKIDQTWSSILVSKLFVHIDWEPVTGTSPNLRVKEEQMHSVVYVFSSVGLKLKMLKEPQLLYFGTENFEHFRFQSI